MKKLILKKLYIAFGLVCLALGICGIFVPLLPTTPFLLLAAWSFQQGSQKLHEWLINQPTLGPTISNWQKYGVIRLRAKILAIVLIASSFTWILATREIPQWLQIIMVLFSSSLCLFLATRPSHIPKP